MDGGLFIMENQSIDASDANSMTTIKHKNEIGLPIIALCLDFAPVLLVFLGSLVRGLSSAALLLALLLPVAGLITGIVSLSRGKARIGIVGKILAIIAIVLPLAFVAFIVILFIGAVTGLISFM